MWTLLAKRLTEETPKNKVPRRSRVTKGEVDDIDDSTPKNTVIGKSDEDDVMVIIPDLMDVGEDDLVNTIATAPNVRPSDIVRTIGELENEMAASDVLLTQIQPSSIPGLDLSILISNAFCSLEQSEENDTVWDWDIVLNQVTMEMSK
ncbi:intraflagellar transport protein 43 [Globomyces pollinis-pini]|nr:intraflagellar transport protein 43 [Globomyces pollinis-pini]